jgi:hypothetical protein
MYCQWSREKSTTQNHAQIRHCIKGPLKAKRHYISQAALGAHDPQRFKRWQINRGQWHPHPENERPTTAMANADHLNACATRGCQAAAIAWFLDARTNVPYGEPTAANQSIATRLNQLISHDLHLGEISPEDPAETQCPAVKRAVSYRSRRQTSPSPVLLSGTCNTSKPVTSD